MASLLSLRPLPPAPTGLPLDAQHAVTVRARFMSSINGKEVTQHFIASMSVQLHWDRCSPCSGTGVHDARNTQAKRAEVFCSAWSRSSSSSHSAISSSTFATIRDCSARGGVAFQYQELKSFQAIWQRRKKVEVERYRGASTPSLEPPLRNLWGMRQMPSMNTIESEAMSG